MAAEAFPCLKCSQLNTIGQTTCKNCGAGFKQVSHSITHMEKVAGRRSTLILNFIIVVAILGIMIAVAVPKAFSYSTSARLSAARGIGSAISATIKVKHSDYLINGVPYTLEDCLAGTSFTGGFAYNTTPNNTPAIGEICSNVAGDKICVNIKGKQFDWDYIPRNGETAAKIVEGENFWKPAETDSTLNLIITFVVLLGFIIVVSLPFYFKNPPFIPTSATRADLNKALKKISNACILGLVPAGCFCFFFIVMPSISGNITNLESFFLAFPITAVLCVLPFGVYKRSRFCAIVMFMLIVIVVACLFFFVCEISEDNCVNIVAGCVSFTLLYFAFDGIRGTFTYHKLLIKTIQEKIKGNQVTPYLFT